MVKILPNTKKVKLFEVVTATLNDKNMKYKRYYVNKNYFYALKRSVAMLQIVIYFEKFKLVFNFSLGTAQDF